MFDETDVTSWAVVEDEQIGSKEKEWLQEPGGSSWLWKARTYNRDRRRDTTFPKGDDWAEKIASNLGQALVPVAQVELAVRGEEVGTISRDFRASGTPELRLGNELLAAKDPDYPTSPARNDPAYTLDAVTRVLDGLEVPAKHPVRALAADWFAGYLLLDAWIGNTDRHHQNWGALQAEDGSLTLAPSYDHASSLGFQISDDERADRLDRSARAEGSVEWWAERAGTPFAGHQSPYDVAAEALAACAAAVRDGWTEDLRQAARGIEGTIETVPEHRMSRPAKAFATRLLRHNLARLVTVAS